MLLINGVSNSIHVLTRYSEEAVHPGVSRKDASRRTIRQMLVACLGAFATAAVGFYVLRTASSPVLQEFGTQAAMGLSFLYFTVILTLGALLALLQAAGVSGFPRLAWPFRGAGHGRRAGSSAGAGRPSASFW